MAPFDGKIALVTGAGSGIGRAVALRLASEGALVCCTDVDESACAETAAAILAAGGKADSRPLDVSYAGACEAAVASWAEEMGGLDVLCNVAGVGFYDHAEATSPEQWQRVIGVNLSGTFYMCRAAIPHLLERKGNIVNMASAAGLVGIAYGAAYSASKGGVVLLTRSLAVEYAHRGLRVNCVCPGGVDTALTRAWKPPEGARPELLARMSLVPGLMKPEEIAGAVAFLASDEARHVNGVAFPVDTGQVA